MDRKKARKKATELVSQMTLAEKASVDSAAVNGSSLEHFSWHGTEKSGKQENGHWQGEGNIRNHQSALGIGKTKFRKSYKKRNQNTMYWNHHSDEEEGVHEFR